jgi:hypothetical protein
MFNVKKQGGIALAVLLGLLVTVLTSCGGGGSVATRYADAYGKGKPGAVPTVTVEFDNGYEITVVSKAQIASVDLTFATGQVESYKLNKKGQCFSTNTAPLTNVHVLSKSGDYWYFDRAGQPMPVDNGDAADGEKGASLLGGVVDGTLGLVDDVLNPADAVKLVVVSASPFKAKVYAEGSSLKGAKLVFANGKTQPFALSGSYGVIYSGAGNELSYVQVVQGSGSKWFFDRSGMLLPEGYKPRITVCVLQNDSELGTVKLASGKKNKRASALLSSIVSVTSSDLYSEVKVGLSTDAVATFETTATSGEYDTQSEGEVEAVRVTLAADGSKWYFDQYGNLLPLDSKWYTDLD